MTNILFFLKRAFQVDYFEVSIVKIIFIKPFLETCWVLPSYVGWRVVSTFCNQHSVYQAVVEVYLQTITPKYLNKFCYFEFVLTTWNLG